MKKTYFTIIIFLFLGIIAVEGIDISDYPHMFVSGTTFQPTYVIGDEAPSLDVVSATIISTAIAQYPQYDVKIGTSKIASEIINIKKINAIVIGNPCINSAAAELEGNPTFCYQGLEGGRGYVKIFSNNGKYQLLITGISAEDRKAMAEFLAEKDLEDLAVTEYSISTFSGSKTKVPEQTKTIQTTKIEPKTVEEQKEETTKEIIPKTKDEKEEIKVEQKEEEKITEILKETKPKKRFFGKVFSAIGNFFRYLFS